MEKHRKMSCKLGRESRQNKTQTNLLKQSPYSTIQNVRDQCFGHKIYAKTESSPCASYIYLESLVKALPKYHRSFSPDNQHTERKTMQHSYVLRTSIFSVEPPIESNNRS